MQICSNPSYGRYSDSNNCTIAGIPAAPESMLALMPELADVDVGADAGAYAVTNPG